MRILVVVKGMEAVVVLVGYYDPAKSYSNQYMTTKYQEWFTATGIGLRG